MRIITLKDTIPQLATRLAGIKTMEQYKFDGYGQDQSIMTAPSGDLPLKDAMDIARVATVEVYEYWIEIPNANLADDVPAGLSFSTYFNEDPVPVEVNRKWNELGELAPNFAATATMRFWQPSSDGQFLFEDVEIIIESGFEVFGRASLNIKMNDDYEDTGDPEYAVTENIEWIDQNWRFGTYFDFVHAYLRMQELYVAKGPSDLDRWNACTSDEQIVLIKWNLVGINRAASIAPVGWSEGRTLKELSKLYREFNFNTSLALEKRFNDYYQYLQLILSGSGRAKFENDWSWDLKSEYISNGMRFYELGSFNALMSWHNSVLSTYVDADFVGVTLTAAQLTSALYDVITEKQYFI